MGESLRDVQWKPDKRTCSASDLRKREEVGRGLEGETDHPAQPPIVVREIRTLCIPLVLLQSRFPFCHVSSNLNRHVHDFFSERHKTTIGVDFARKELVVKGTTVKLQLWDIAKQVSEKKTKPKQKRPPKGIEML